MNQGQNIDQNQAKKLNKRRRKRGGSAPKSNIPQLNTNHIQDYQRFDYVIWSYIMIMNLF